MKEFTEETVDKISDLKEQAGDALEGAALKASETLEEGKDYLKGSYLPGILGALAAGIVLGLLIPRKPTPPASILEARIDELKDLIGSFRSKVSSTAEDQYDGISSALGCAVKKAKKRFNLL